MCPLAVGNRLASALGAAPGHFFDRVRLSAHSLKLSNHITPRGVTDLGAVRI